MRPGKELKFGMVGAGFWAHYQLSGWKEIPGVRCVAICNRTRSRARDLAERFAIPGVYDDARALFEGENLDFVDIVTGVETHRAFVLEAARRRIPVICQKPMAASWRDAVEMVRVCRRRRVPFAIHENWRWQTPVLELKRVLDAGTIGRPFRARIDMISGFPVFKNQPFLKALDQFILTDLGSHTLDTARFLFGEASILYCQTRRVHTGIRGEDVATVMMEMGDRITVTVNMAYAGNPLERECFPQTLFFIEGGEGSIEVAPDYQLRVTTREGTLSRRVAPPRYAWADPAYEVVHASIVPCLQDLAAAIRGNRPARTSGEDNLETLRLVFAAYESARDRKAIRVPGR